PAENSVLIYDDKTLLIGDRDVIIKSIETKTANANQTAKTLIARSPDALVSFGANFRNVDMTEFANVIGEQKFAWQMVGSLDSTGNDFSVTMAFEKTDVPYVFQGKKADSPSMLKAPEVPGGDEVKDLVESMFKSMIGIEAKVMIRFDKQKTAVVIEKTPDIFRKMLKR
ncbi:MAG: hypothetical protein ABIP06_07170, partial [Pyrinomonadaceae bacterium]